MIRRWSKSISRRLLSTPRWRQALQKRPSAQGGKPSPAKPALSAAQRRRRRPKQIFFGFMAGSALLALLVYLFYPRPNPEEEWNKAMIHYQTNKFKPAKLAFLQFKKTFPEHPNSADVPFFVDMCDSGRDMRSQAGDPEVGLSKLQEIFKKYRDTETYTRWRSELFQSALLLIDKFVSQAEKGLEPKSIKLARSAEELLNTIVLSMPKDDDISKEQAKLAASIRSAEQKVAVAQDRAQLVALLKEAADPEGKRPIEALLADSRALLAKRPKFGDEEEIQNLLRDAYASEARRVRYAQERGGADSEQPTVARDEGVYLVWGEPLATPEATAHDEICMALARGVLYVFDSSGRFRWARRLGVDSYRLPVKTFGSSSAPAALLAVSTLDNALLALNAATGEVLWTYRPGDQRDLFAPLTLVMLESSTGGSPRQVGLLPTVNGEIHVMELAGGRRIGRYTTGQPMTVGGCYDEDSGLVYFPADNQRLYAINPRAIEEPSQPACRGVLHTKHPSASLRSEPTVVGRYLVLAEASELEQMKLRVFEINLPPSGQHATDPFPKPDAGPLKERALPGWSWFAPAATPDRVAVITDEGTLGVFGLNLDNPQEAIYPFIQDQQGKCPQLDIHDPYRSLAIYCDEHLLWFMAGGKLQKYSLDVLNQRVIPQTLPTGLGAVTGVPAHEAQADSWNRVFYLACMSPGGEQYCLQAFDTEQDRSLWRNRLGVSLSGDPLADADGVTLIDEDGRLIRLSPRQLTQGADLQLPETGDPLAAAGPQEQLRVQDPTGPLCQLIVQDAGRRLAWRPLTGANAPADWVTAALPAPLRGLPSIRGPILIAPCADGRLHRRRLDGQEAASNEAPFTWASAGQLLPDDTAEVHALAEDTVLLVEPTRRVRRLEHGASEGVWQWKEVGSQLALSSPLIGHALVDGQRLIFADEDGLVTSVSCQNPRERQRVWPLDGKITSAPFKRGDGLFVIVDERTVVCLESPASKNPEGPVWTVGPLSGASWDCRR